jgi:LacI family transcriptional regulator
MKTKARKTNRPPTIIDVAREASVGVMTVSRVINNHPSVKPTTRSKVMSAIARVGYVQNDAARMLKGRRGRTIGLIVPDLTDFFAGCFHAVQEVAMRHDYQTLVVATGRSAAIESRQLEAINNHQIAGLIIVTSGADIQKLKSLLDSGIPVVALDRPIPGLQVDAVLVENREGAELGVRHLIEHGHKKIACIGSEGGSFTVRERFEGYRQAVRGAGLDPITFNNINALEDMEALTHQWAGAKDRPTAAFSTKRLTSIRLIQALHRQKLRVPQDIALVGFDDFELAEVLGSPLTVVWQSPTEIARAAAELLFRQIPPALDAQAPTKQAAKMVFPTRLIIRRSCGCP